ncbi:MAG TPA: S8 family serine peptidase [Pyrinomonadaceae bacterium]|nr:S8 family serine peptidase [Pyrinomonadaceae bacterium]
MQSDPSTHGKLASKPVALGFLLLLLVTSILFAPRSEATRQVNAENNSENQAGASEKRRHPEFVPGEALVRFKRNRAFEGVEYLEVPNNNASVQAYPETGSRGSAPSTEQVLVNVERFEGSDLIDGLRIARMAPDDTLKAVDAFEARDDVLYAEPNYILHGDVTPNDPRFVSNELYGLTRIGGPQAWDITTGNRSVVVGVIDEGIDVNHPDLLANIWKNPSPGSIAGITDDLHGYNFRDNIGTIPPELHATHVAGIIGAVGNNNEGVVGVNWQVSLMTLRFIDQTTNSGTDADAIKAYVYAKQMRDLWVSTGGTKGANIRVLNASYGSGGYSQATADAINALGLSGILFVASAGNERQNNDTTPHYPSNYNLPNVVSVAASNQSDQVAIFSNYGEQTVLMGAPGENILSTTPNNTYSLLSGTSMAAPHVSGAAALLCAANPNLSTNQLRALLAFNGDANTSFTPALTTSGRRLNVFKSLQALSENDTTPPGSVTNLRVTSRLNLSADLAWTASGDDGLTGQASLYKFTFIDKITGAETQLLNAKPALSGAQQNDKVLLPYRHINGSIKVREFDNFGNEGLPAIIPVTTEAMTADPYEVTLVAPAPLSTGGTPLGLTYDDRYLTYSLPFDIPFFTRTLGSRTFSSVTISTNGNLFFFDNAVGPSPPTRPNGDADDVPSSKNQLSQFQMISGMWDDLDLSTSRRSDADVYVVSPDAAHPERIIFRWQGVQFGDGTKGDPINFEIELNRNGTITTRYGAGNTNLFPVVGIAGGVPDAYVVDSHTSEISPISLTNAPSVVFARRTRPLIQVGANNYNIAESGGHATVVVNRSGDVTAETTVEYETSDLAGAASCSAKNTSVASSRCDYVPTTGRLNFAVNETSKTIQIPIIDDSFSEGNEIFTLTLTSATQALLGGNDRATITIIDNDTSTAANPLDDSDATFFVRQHYLDFLNREPDASGLAFWSNNISNCSPKPSCTEIQRINTSAAFFLSIEFQDTGYLVERIYKAAYGDGSGSSTFGTNPQPHQLPVPIIRLNEFLADTQKIGQGVIVGQGNWQQQLNDNKNTFTEEFVQRSRFIAAYPFNLTPTQFVEGLDGKAGGMLTPSQHGQLISDLSAGRLTRGQVLRAVAESQNFTNAEFNRAFVLMQFFGYLRRNPNDPQDTDYSGYDFWLTKLNSFTVPGDDPLIRAQRAEMVKAFITSAEYRQRVGP